jgi:hypothetical protein
MENSLFAFLDMAIALGFVLGLGILELVCLRLDKKRAAQQDRSDDADPGPGRS